MNLRKSNTNTAVFKVVAWLIKKPEKLKEKDDLKLFDLEDPDKYIYKEDEIIKSVRIIKEEERKKRDQENVIKIKNDKLRSNIKNMKFKKNYSINQRKLRNSKKRMSQLIH